MPAAPPRRRRASLLLLVASAVAIGTWLWSLPREDELAESAAHESARPRHESSPSRARPSSPVGPAVPFDREAHADGPADGCTPRVSSACVMGDVYWIDSCGEHGDKKQECGSSLCRDDACQAQDERACQALPLEGRCEGEVVRGCVGGQPYEVDCAALGKRCVTTHEGAGCHVPSKDDCVPDTPLRCDGNELVGCRDGSKLRVHCASEGGVCGKLPGDEHFACYRVERLAAAPASESDCGACGCPERSALGEDVCDGVDNDGDEVVDEGSECEAVDVVAFVVADASGASSYAREDIEREIERVNQIFASGAHGLGLRVQLADTVTLNNREWLDLDDDEFQDLLRGDVLLLDREAFFIPVIFTDHVSADDVTKAGKSTLPNGHCGGRRVTDSPGTAGGAIVVAKGRAATTVAHEIGHFLGLCHTHFDFDETVRRVVEYTDADGRLVQQTCSPACVDDGDGMCDTPPDPGPDECSYDSTCTVGCRGGEQPDAFNVMSYYTSCRYTLSQMQALELRRMLALRRGWYPCQRPGSCPCDPTAPQCPRGMTCQPPGAGEGGLWACVVEGARAEGEPCRRHRDCADALCRNGHCATLE